MQVTGQNSNQILTGVTKPVNTSAAQPQALQQPVPASCSTCQAQTPAPVNYNYPPQTAQYPAGYNPVQNTVYPQYQSSQNQTTPVSGASGVTIQIFNPSVQTPGAQAPTYNVNAPCYPAGYYTGQLGPDGKIHTQNGTGQQGGNPSPTGGNIDTHGGNVNTGGGNVDGPVNTGTNTGTMGDNNNNTTTINNNNNGAASTDGKKTEKRKIVQLTDDYIRNLENYLNSQDKNVRLSAAKEVFARLEEDDSRFDDKALTALVNKMLQDPSEEVRILALTALDGRLCKGDDYTVGVLQNMQKSDGAYGQDAVEASNILLKMSGKQVEKEFEVKDKDKKAEQAKKAPESSIKKQ